LGGNVPSVKENAASFLFSKEFGLEVNADKSKYIVMSGDQNAGRSYSMKTDDSSFERVGSSDIWKQTSRIEFLFRKN